MKTESEILGVFAGLIAFQLALIILIWLAYYF